MSQINQIPQRGKYCIGCPCLIYGGLLWGCTLFNDSLKTLETNKRPLRLNKCLEQKPKIIVQKNKKKEK